MTGAEKVIFVKIENALANLCKAKRICGKDHKVKTSECV